MVSEMSVRMGASGGGFSLRPVTQKDKRPNPRRKVKNHFVPLIFTLQFLQDLAVGTDVADQVNQVGEAEPSGSGRPKTLPIEREQLLVPKKGDSIFGVAGEVYQPATTPNDIRRLLVPTPESLRLM